MTADFAGIALSYDDIQASGATRILWVRYVMKGRCRPAAEQS